MIRKNKLTNGIADPVSMILVAVVVLVVAVLIYFLLGKPQTTPDQTATQQAAPTISASDEIEVMEEELEMIDVGDIEDDLQELETEASSL
jgi:flagellar basal body-associated protein FliL